MIGCTPEQCSILVNKSNQSSSSVIFIPEWQSNVLSSEKLVIIRKSTIFWGRFDPKSIGKLFKYENPISYWKKRRNNQGISSVFNFGNILSHKDPKDGVAELASEFFLQALDTTVSSAILTPLHLGLFLLLIVRLWTRFLWDLSGFDQGYKILGYYKSSAVCCPA
jgi:hypothetical protein